MNKIAIIAGTRPNFVKIAPLAAELKKTQTPYFIVNTGQHFSREMSKDFLKELSVIPDYKLRPSQATSLTQFSQILIGLEKVFNKEKPSLVIVVGDVNSTLAGALSAKKLNIKLAHIEAGLRSYNQKMPEEYNRVLTDHLADILFASSKNDIENLKRENLTGKVYLVGNIMIDALATFNKTPLPNNEKGEFYFCTLHRAENVDDRKVFSEILDALEIISADCRIYLPLHPRTKERVQQFGLAKKIKQIFTLLPSIGYRQSISFQKNAKLILTDSGGVQEEASYLGTPCLTLRTETERPVTIDFGTNTLAGVTKQSILKAYRQKPLKKMTSKIPFWDGKTSSRIVKVLIREK